MGNGADDNGENGEDNVTRKAKNLDLREPGEEPPPQRPWSLFDDHGDWALRRSFLSTFTPKNVYLSDW